MEQPPNNYFLTTTPTTAQSYAKKSHPIPYTSFKNEPKAILRSRANVHKVIFHGNLIFGISKVKLYEWNIDNDEKEFKYSRKTEELCKSTLIDLCLLSNSEILITGGRYVEKNANESELIIWNTSTLSIRKRIRNPEKSAIYVTKVDPNDQLLITGHDYGNISVFHITYENATDEIDLVLLRKVGTGIDSICQIFFVCSDPPSLQEKFPIIAFCRSHSDEQVALFDAKSGTILNRFKRSSIETIKNQSLNYVAYSTIFGLIGVAQNNILILLDISGSEWKEIHHVETPDQMYNVVSCDSPLPLVFTSSHHSIHIWTLPLFTPISQTQDFEISYGPSLHPSGLIFTTHEDDKKISIWCDDSISSLQEFLTNYQ
jgi:hypothetical protein